MTACGLDFGTSNTTLGLSESGRPALVRLEGEDVTIPSATFFAPAVSASAGTSLVGPGIWLPFPAFERVRYPVGSSSELVTGGTVNSYVK